MSESIIDGIPAKMYLDMKPIDIQICQSVLKYSECSIDAFVRLKGGELPDEINIKEQVDMGKMYDDIPLLDFVNSVSVFYFNDFILSVHYDIDIAFINLKSTLEPNEAAKITMLVIDSLQDITKAIKISTNYIIVHNTEIDKVEILFGEKSKTAKEYMIWQSTESKMSREKMLDDILLKEPDHAMIEH